MHKILNQWWCENVGILESTFKWVWIIQFLYNNNKSSIIEYFQLYPVKFAATDGESHEDPKRVNDKH